MPKVLVETKFYEYCQNNSGGSFHVIEDKGIGHYVVVEATSAAEADVRAEQIGLYFDGCSTERDCRCCGDRWSEARGDEGTEEPTLEGKPLEAYRSSGRRELAFVHYMDGRIEKRELPQKQSRS